MTNTRAQVSMVSLVPSGKRLIYPTWLPVNRFRGAAARRKAGPIYAPIQTGWPYVRMSAPNSAERLRNTATQSKMRQIRILQMIEKSALILSLVLDRELPKYVVSPFRGARLSSHRVRRATNPYM